MNRYMLVDSDDLAAIGDLAARYGVGHSTMHYWSKRAGFPEPITTLSFGHVWSRFAVDEWVKEHRAVQAAKKLFREASEIVGKKPPQEAA